MNNEEKPSPSPPNASLVRKWVGLLGLSVTAASIFAFILLFSLELIAPSGNPYLGILAYLIAPAFLILGLALILAGWILRRREFLRFRVVEGRPFVMFDLSARRDRRNLVVFIVVTTVFLLFTAIASYRSYHFTESVEFCGQACHTVMKPEYTTYLHSPHARVSCSECHIGSGATWYVKAKISGTYQLYATAFEKYQRPIKTPIANLRPAQETCEQCHWPQKFVGNLDRTYTHFLTDETNSVYSVRMLLKVGGGDPTHGPVSGIHWHMNVANKVEYIATDGKNQEIPWVRSTDAQGVVTEYWAPGFTDDPKKFKMHRMDCMDCHNRPSHIFKSPNESVDMALALGRLDRSLPFIKKEAVDALTGEYETESEALQRIATTLANTYPDHAKVKETIAEVQRIYSANFFPEMRANWSVYPNNIGHKDWPGCFRCHDDEHKTADAKKVIKGSECKTCHVIIAQGNTMDLSELSTAGLEFAHPEEGWEGMMCNDCHTGKND